MKLIQYPEINDKVLLIFPGEAEVTSIKTVTTTHKITLSNGDPAFYEMDKLKWDGHFMGWIFVSMKKVTLFLITPFLWLFWGILAGIYAICIFADYLAERE